MFLSRLQKVFICTEKNSIRRALSFTNGMKSIQQHARCVSNIQYPQNVSDSVATDFTAVEKVWKQNQDNKIHDFLIQCFEKETDCFSYAVYLMAQACENKSSADLAFSVIKAFELWQKSNGISQQLNTQVQSEALVAALSSKNRFLVQLACDVFKISSHCDFVDDIVENYLLYGKIDEAAICVFALKMQEKYPIEKIVLPLIFKGLVNLAIMYIGENKDLQLKVIKSLDDSLKPEEQSAQKGKLISKRLSSLLSAFHIPPETCPNLLEIRKKCTMNLLMRKRYSEKSMTDSQWEDIIMELLQDSPNLRKKLIWKLVAVQDLDTAMKMASTFQIPADEWPPVLKNFGKNEELPDFTCDAVKINEENNTDVEYLSLELDKSCLEYIETAEQFEDCLSNISENYEVVGFDSEWKPSFGVSDSRLALMQLAVEDKVYLLDILALSACLKKSHWDSLIETFFGNPKLLKLGCGLMSDVDIFVRNYQGTIGIPLKFSRLLDLAVLVQKFHFARPDIFPADDGNIFNIGQTLGLSKICALVLGSPLKKQQQFSNWEVRPLDDSQLYYAALDAYCLLQIYNKLQEVAKEHNLDFKKFQHQSITFPSESSRLNFDLRRRVKSYKYYEGFEIRPVISVKELKLLVDPRLESLGKGLKNYGVDVTFLENISNSSDVIKLAKAEARFILAGSLLYEQLKGLADERFCHEITENFADDPSNIAYVLQKFNVRFQAGDISFPEQSGT